MSNNRFIDKFKKFVPGSIRKVIRKSIPLVDYNIHFRQQRNPFFSDPDEMIFPESPVVVGIFKEFYQYHKSYIAACRDLKISYKLIELSAADWQERVLASGCDAFLVWPSVGITLWKEMVDDRVRILSEDLKKIVYPSVKEIWLYENKIRTADWLKAHKIPQPKTWVFNKLDDAVEFAQTCELPIVYKTNIGASASGVKILRERGALVDFVKKAFNKGIVPQGHHPLDRHWGRVYLQQYLADVEEWRMIRIGDSYFGYRKEKVGDFHSGSHAWSWLDPGKQLLDFLKLVTDEGGFSSMDVDIFRDKQGNLFVNELQTVFGASTPKEMLMIDGVEGRYIYKDNNWVFEAGPFSDNQCSNLRVKELIKIIGERK